MPVDDATPPISQSAPTPATEEIIVYPRRKPWVAFLLEFFTLGFYGCFWFIARARELNRIDPKRYTPWLWFFVPFIFLAQLIALPKIFGHLRELTHDKISPKLISTCIGITALITFVSTLERWIEFPLWSIFIFMLISASLTAIAQSWVNQVKATQPNLKEKESIPANIGLSLLLLLGLVFWGFIGFAMYDEAKAHLSAEPVKNGQKISPEGHPIYFHVVGNEYSIAHTTNTDQIMRLKGQFLTMNWYVFGYGFDESVDSMLESRILEFKEGELGTIECQSEKFFQEGTLNIVGLAYCESKLLNDPHISVISFISSKDKGLYELYGEFSTVERDYKRLKEEFIGMARGISL